MVFGRPYINKEWYSTIAKYQYKGEDHSIFHNYVANPLCNILVLLFPKWIAPNIITLMGLLCNIIFNVLTLYYTGLMGKGECPSWVAYLGAFLYFSYFLLDIIDGKQARRTNSSSPLGMMFDHGCDALTTFVFTLSLSSVVHQDEPIYYSLLWFMACGAFFFTTLEEYFTDIMYFPIIHGVSEGTLCACIAIIFAGFKGGDFFKNTIVDLYISKLRLNDFLTIIFFFISNIFSVISIVKIIRKFKERMLEALYYTTSFLIIISSLIIVQISYKENHQAYLANSKLLIYLYGFAFAKLMGHLQLAHLAKVRFHQFRRTITTSSLVLCVVAIFESHLGFSLVDINNLIVFFLIFNFLAWFHFAYYVSEEMCGILNIKIFRIQSSKLN